MHEVDWKLKISDAVTELAQCKFFPSDEGVRVAIMKLLLRLVEFGRADQLNWLVRSMVDKIGIWNGPLELRGVFCTRFKPADGIEANCIETHGFTPSDLETRTTAPRLMAPEARKMLTGIVEGDDDSDIQAIIDLIARMPAPTPNVSAERTPARTDRQRQLAAESVKDHLQPERRRRLTAEGRARLASFYGAQVEELATEAPAKEGAKAQG